MTDLASVKRIGIIGGSGLQRLEELSDQRDVEITTPFGTEAVSLQLGRLRDANVAVLQRHGGGHRIPPTHINVRSNIAALKRVGCTQVLSLSSVGSLREDVPPGTFVLIDQFIDRTYSREKTFFGPGLVGHVPFGEPTCTRMRRIMLGGAAEGCIAIRTSGTYVVMEGPQFSTKAESELYRQWGGTVIGMTGMPEAKLAREAEMCYSIIAMATDYDCWKEGEPPVTASTVSFRMASMRRNVNAFLAAAVGRLQSVSNGGAPCLCSHALDTAIMTASESRDPVMLEKLAFVVPRIRDI